MTELNNAENPPANSNYVSTFDYEDVIIILLIIVIFILVSFNLYLIIYYFWILNKNTVSQLFEEYNLSDIGKREVQ